MREPLLSLQQQGPLRLSREGGLLSGSAHPHSDSLEIKIRILQGNLNLFFAPTITESLFFIEQIVCVYQSAVETTRPSPNSRTLPVKLQREVVGGGGQEGKSRAEDDNVKTR